MNLLYGLILIGDLFYDQPNNGIYATKTESIHYNTAITITNAIKNISPLKIYNELGFEFLKLRR